MLFHLRRMGLVFALSVFLISAARASIESPSTKLPGDTMESAFLVESLPFFASGTTVGYNDDYEASCPYASPAPDVIYQFTPPSDMRITIDLCGSQYDTQLFVFDAELNEVACSSDYYYTDQPCGLDVSRISDCSLMSGMTYFIAVDGGPGSASGEFELGIWEIGACSAPVSGGTPEGEPSLVDGYVDVFNGGCNGSGNYFEEAQGDVSGMVAIDGVSGWYQTQGTNHRDWDMFHGIAGPDGEVGFSLFSECSMQLYVMSECQGWSPLCSLQVAPCQQGDLSFWGQPDQEFWILLTPVDLQLPGNLANNEFSYSLEISGLEAGPAATYPLNLGHMKALYRGPTR